MDVSQKAIVPTSDSVCVKANEWIVRYCIMITDKLLGRGKGC